jgi:PKHD-type hydroxylase
MTYTTIYNDPYSRAKFIEPWVYWDNAFTDEELEKIVMYCEQFDIEPGTTFGDSSVRNSGVKFHQRNEDTAWIFDRLNFVIQSVNEIYYNFDLNGYSQFQYTTYNGNKNEHYDWHMDLSMGNGNFLPSDAEPRKLSLSLCLNDGFEGGEFSVNSGKSDLVPTKKGRIIFFPSFMLHKVAPVTKGTRRSIVVWILGPKFR